MSRRGNAPNRCVRCRMHASLCVCSLLPRLETRTRVCLVIHRFEDRKPTNTGRLATECLVNSQVVVRGEPLEAEAALAWDAGTEPLVLFPYDDALPLAQFAGHERPVTLIVPDGNWRQASKVPKRVPELRGVRCVTLPPGVASRYRLRTEAHDKGMSTLEAIARAVGILESVAIQRELERVLDVMVERTLWSRGTVSATDVRASIPEGARRHDPKTRFLER